MAFERVFLAGIIELEYDAPAGATVLFYTDLPGNAIALRETLAVPASTTRRTAKFRLKGTTKGKLYRVKVTSTGRVILYGGRVYLRSLGLSSEWAWFALPITASANTFTEWKLPIEPTAEKYTEFKLPIEGTGEKYSEYKIPLHPTAELFSWVNVEVSK
jgi:hypothetical protein